VAGIVAARGGNGVGVAGLAWRARIMAVKVLGADASGDMATVAAGVRYAVAHGARVVNLSLTGPSPGPDLAAAVDAAGRRQRPGRRGRGQRARRRRRGGELPADLDAPNLVAVTSSDQRGGLAPSASFGRSTVDLAAPGEEILSTARGGGYELRSGSSMAAAQVSGAAVLLGSARPDLGWAGMRSALLGSARPTSLPVAAGRLDVAAALRRVLGRKRGRSQVSAERRSAGRLRRPPRPPHRPRHRSAVARVAVAK
jgi:subtilisin family serine protease